jgi:sec-independent protein translocase protein TatB
MFGVDSGELLLIMLVAVMVIGPKDLPRVMRTVGQWVSRARGMANQFRMGVDEMVRDSEIADLEAKWREQNEAIMRAHPMTGPEQPSFAPPPPLPSAPLAEPADSGWGLGLMDDAAAPAARQGFRPAPMPPVGSLPDRPIRPRLDKDSAPPAAAPPQLAKAPAAPPSGRRPPRAAPQAKRP